MEEWPEIYEVAALKIKVVFQELEKARKQILSYNLQKKIPLSQHYDFVWVKLT